MNAPRDLPDSTNDLAALTDGKLTASVTYVGGGETGATKTIAKDTSAPSAPTATPGAGLYNKAQTVELAAEPGAEIRYTNQGAPAQPDTPYAGPIAVSSTQTIRAIAVDKAGNPSADASSFAYTIDAVAPATPGIDLTAASDSDSSRTDNRTNDATPTFAGRTEAGASVRLFVDGAVRGSAVADAGGNYSVTSGALANGAHRVFAEARDAAGNTSRSAVLPITVDLVRPTVAAKSPVANALRVGLPANVTARFGEPVSRVNGATFVLKRGATKIPAVVTYNTTTKVATLNPSRNLAPRTTYTATLTGGIKDSSGNTLAPVVWKFKTR